MGLQKFGTGRIIDEEQKPIEKAASKSDADWTEEDQAALVQESAK